MHLQVRLGTAIASQTRILNCQYRWICANMIFLLLVFCGANDHKINNNHFSYGEESIINNRVFCYIVITNVFPLATLYQIIKVSVR
jgi:hypothetical protein